MGQINQISQFKNHQTLLIVEISSGLNQWKWSVHISQTDQQVSQSSKWLVRYTYVNLVCESNILPYIVTDSFRLQFFKQNLSTVISGTRNTSNTLPRSMKMHFKALRFHNSSPHTGGYSEIILGKQLW